MKRRLLSAVMVISLTAASRVQQFTGTGDKGGSGGGRGSKRGPVGSRGRKCRGSGRENIYNCHRCEGYVGSVVSAPSGRR